MKKSYLFLSTLLSANFLFSQEYFESLPENPDPNKCFAKCVIPDEYAEEPLTVIVKPEHETLEVIPAVYKTEYEEVIIRPAFLFLVSFSFRCRISPFVPVHPFRFVTRPFRHTFPRHMLLPLGVLRIV